MKHLLSLPLLATALLLAACDVPANIGAPISAPGGASYDARLVGAWYIVSGAEDEADAAMLVVTPGAGGALDVTGFMTSLIRRRLDGDDTSGLADRLGTVTARWTVYPSAIDGQTYFNARLTDSVEIERRGGKEPSTKKLALLAVQPERGFWIFRAAITGKGLLRLDPLWSDELRRLGHIGREVSCGEDCSFEVFDLSSAELAALIRTAEPGTLFTQSIGPFARIDGIHPPRPDE